MFTMGKMEGLCWGSGGWAWMRDFVPRTLLSYKIGTSLKMMSVNFFKGHYGC